MNNIEKELGEVQRAHRHNLTDKRWQGILYLAIKEAEGWDQKEIEDFNRDHPRINFDIYLRDIKKEHETMKLLNELSR